MIAIKAADLNDAQVRHVIETHIAYGDAHYPAESNHHLTVEAHGDNGVLLFSAWLGRECLGVVGFKPLDERACELKTMHVLEAGRGRGVGAALVEHALTFAKQRGWRAIFLETGSKDASNVARHLYERFGFVYCPPFGDYVEDPESVFMKLSI